MLRNDVKCFGFDCYSLAFGVPAGFMFLSIVVFVIGTPYYKRANDKKKENIITKTVNCIFTALKIKLTSKKYNVKKEHWLDYAEEKHSKKLISDVKAFCRVVVIYLPLPVFWALYDQQGLLLMNELD